MSLFSPAEGDPEFEFRTDENITIQKIQSENVQKMKGSNMKPSEIQIKYLNKSNKLSLEKQQKDIDLIREGGSSEGQDDPSNDNYNRRLSQKQNSNCYTLLADKEPTQKQEKNEKQKIIGLNDRNESRVSNVQKSLNDSILEESSQRFSPNSMDIEYQKGSILHNPFEKKEKFESFQEVEDDEMKEPQPISFHKFFRYNSRKDNCMLFIGTISAIIAGLFLPSIALIMGSIAKNFGDSDLEPSEMTEIIAQTSKLVVGVAIIIAVFSYIFFAFWQHLAENISLKLRKIYLKRLLSQEVAYFEKIKIEEIPTKMGEIFETVQNSIGEKYANLIFSVFQGIGGCMYAFYTGKRFAVILVGSLPVFFLILGTFGIMVKKSSGQRLDIIKQMGGVVSETLYAIKVVASFGTEERELEKFMIWTKNTEVVGKKFQCRFAFMFGIMKFAIFSFYGFSFYVGSEFIKQSIPNSNYNDEPYTPQDVITILIALITGYISLIASLPSIQAVMQAKQVGGEIFAVIDRVPKIKDEPYAISHFTLSREIVFENVTFKYPTAPKEQRYLFENVSFKIKAGESTAIVGPSGYGKSTIVQMIERFYDPSLNESDDSLGKIMFDGVDIRKIFLKNLREQIGYVPQEPTLIIGTIRENLQFGNRDANDSDIKDALNKANAQFVFEFEDGLDTFIGTSSVVNLSGGQKQRLAIARALLKKPKILILDEATSALDPVSEKEVQGAIESIEQSQSKFDLNQEKLTILIIAHRLTSIEGAQNLLFIEKRNEINSYVKGTQLYEKVFMKLRNITYVHGEGEEEAQELDKMKSVHQSSIISRSNLNSIMMSEEIDHSNFRPQPERYALSLEEVKIDKIKKLSIKSQSISNKSVLELDSEVNSVSTNSSKRVSTREIMKYYTPGWLAWIGIIASFFASLQLPMFGLLLSKIVFVLMIDPSDPDFLPQRNFWVSMFVVLTFGMFLSSFIQKLSFGICSENLTKTIRIKLFESILYKHIGWFDNRDRAPGVLGNVIQEDISQLNGLTSEVYSVAIESIMGICVSSGLCLYFSWQVGLIAIVMSPLMVFGGFFMSSLQWSQGQIDDEYIQSNALLSDIIMNYRTIISLGEKNIDFILSRYNSLLDEPNKQGIKRAHFSGVLFGYSQSIRFVFVALSFYFASLIIEKFEMDVVQKNNVFTAVYIMFVGAIGAGVSVSQMPSKSKAEKSARKVFAIMQEPSQIDSRLPPSIQNIDIQEGNISFENVEFQYPSRSKKILDGLNLKIRCNESVALVGHSGSGKSTIASLLLRFYNKQSGKIKIDGQNIENFSVKQIRQNIAIVMQEPLLFNEAIIDNIRYGNPQASNQQILEASEQANCLNFIQNNIDQLCVPEIKTQIKQDFNSIIDLNMLTYPQLQKVREMAIRQQIGIEIQLMLKQMFETLRPSGLKIINENIDKFVEYLKKISEKDSESQEVTWNETFMTFIWQIVEVPKIITILKSNTVIFSEKEIESLENYIKIKHWQFDSQALQSYFEYLREPNVENYDDRRSMLSRRESVFAEDKISFSYFLRKYLNKKEYKYWHDKVYNDHVKSESEIVQAENLSLHPGFKKFCGLRGCKLSGGQKQRVAIARALIRNPKILILDEATSALDERSQEIVQEALEEAMKGRTSIVIAHRLSTVKKCDRIVVLNDGRVVEEGTYQKLSEDPNSYFFKLKSGLQQNDE